MHPRPPNTPHDATTLSRARAGADECAALLTTIVNETPAIIRTAVNTDDSSLALAVAQALGQLLSADEPLPLSALEGQVRRARAPLTQRTHRTLPASVSSDAATVHVLHRSCCQPPSRRSMWHLSLR